MIKNNILKLNRKYFYSGLVLSSILLISYFITLEVDSGNNYIVESSLLGIMIFHNPFVLGLYLLLTISLIIKGIFSLK